MPSFDPVMDSMADASGSQNPLALFSIAFRNTIPLKEPLTNETLGARPEWVAGERNIPSAYVRGSFLEMEVVFKALYGPLMTTHLYALGTRGGIKGTKVALLFEAQEALSDAVMVTSTAPLPDEIGAHLYYFDWYAVVYQGQTLYVGSTRHLVYTTWAAPIPPAASPYAPLIHWGCSWAAGQQSPKAICDAILANLARSGLMYGLGGSNFVRTLLLRHGGLCGAWTEMFQHLLHAQGVFVYRRAFTIQTISQPPSCTKNPPEQRWCGIVVEMPGLNLLEPAVPPAPFQDNASHFPIPDGQPAPLVSLTTPRYYFPGSGSGAQTHVLNFLLEDNRLFLYDPSFGGEPVELDSLAPLDDDPMTGEGLAKFKQDYLDRAVAYLSGVLYNGDGNVPDAQPVSQMTVKTTLVSPDAITLVWSDA